MRFLVVSALFLVAAYVVIQPNFQWYPIIDRPACPKPVEPEGIYASYYVMRDGNDFISLNGPGLWVSNELCQKNLARVKPPMNAWEFCYQVKVTYKDAND